MKGLQMKILNKIGIDRVLHFAFGGWIACLGDTWYWAIFIALVLGLTKEAMDSLMNKEPSVVDVMYTVLGGCVTAGYMYCFIT